MENTAFKYSHTPFYVINWFQLQEYDVNGV